MRSTRGVLVRGVAAWGVPGGRAPGTPEKFSKNLYKINEKFTIFLNFQEHFAIFFKFFLKFYRIFGENLDKNLET